MPNERAKIAQERVEQRGGKSVVVARRELTLEERVAALEAEVKALKARGGSA